MLQIVNGLRHSAKTIPGCKLTACALSSQTCTHMWTRHICICLLITNCYICQEAYQEENLEEKFWLHWKFFFRKTCAYTSKLYDLCHTAVQFNEYMLLYCTHIMHENHFGYFFCPWQEHAQPVIGKPAETGDGKMQKKEPARCTHPNENVSK